MGRGSVLTRTSAMPTAGWMGASRITACAGRTVTVVSVPERSYVISNGSPPRSRTKSVTASGVSAGAAPLAPEMPAILSPGASPASDAGEPGRTSATISHAATPSPSATTRGMPTYKAPVKSAHAATAFMKTPATRIIACMPRLLSTKLPLPCWSSPTSPKSRTNPPNGSQFTVYSVPPHFPNVNARGGYPMPNSSTRTRKNLATRKCPSSCTIIRKLSMPITSKIVPMYINYPITNKLPRSQAVAVVYFLRTIGSQRPKSSRRRLRRHLFLFRLERLFQFPVRGIYLFLQFILEAEFVIFRQFSSTLFFLDVFPGFIARTAHCGTGFLEFSFCKLYELGTALGGQFGKHDAHYHAVGSRPDPKVRGGYRDRKST